MTRFASIRVLWAAALLIGALALTGGAAGAAPSADLWEVWEANDPASTIRVDHDFWERFLKAYVVRGGDGINRLAYGRVRPQDRIALEAYLKAMSAVPVPSLARAEQLAFWINLYNALTVKVVLDHYPVATIRDIDISPGFFADGPWGKKLGTVGGMEVSLDDIEHRILRPIWRDPRIHYAVNCASLGCPDLAPEAYGRERIDEQLDAAAENFINHPRGARVEGGKLTVSSIYDWFEGDFDGDGGVIAHLRRYARFPLKEALGGIDRVSDHDYDWDLNDVTGEGAARE